MNIVQSLQHAIDQGNLPGEAAQMKMATRNRMPLSQALKESHEFRQSAVALVLFGPVDNPQFIVLQRNVYDGAHSGQMGLPGGKVDKEDSDLLATARRECFEEIGLDLQDCMFVGEISPVFIPVSNFRVAVFLFYIGELPQLVPDPREVNSLYFPRLVDLLDPSVKRFTTIPLTDKLKIKNVPYYHLEDKIVWGATALMLSEVEEMLLQITKSIE